MNNTNNLNEEIAYAYIAGLIEGEGCIQITQQKKYGKNRGNGFVYRPRIAIKMRDRIPIDFIIQHFPVNILTSNNAFLIQYRTNQTIDIINKTYKYLQFKHDEASTVLDLHKTKLEPHENAPPPEFIEHRKQLYFKCQNYKKKRVKDYETVLPINPPETIIPPTETDLSYLAGIVDGEGSIGIYNTKHKNRIPIQTVTLQISMVRLEAIKKFQTHFGGSIFVRNCFKIKYSSGLAVSVLSQLLPYLKLKKDQAQLCLDLHNKRYSLTIQEKQDFILKCQQYKHKGWIGDIKQIDSICLTDAEINSIPVHKQIRKTQLSQSDRIRLRNNKERVRITNAIKDIVNEIILYYPFHKNNPGLFFTMPLKVLGCSRLELKSYLESQFTNTLSWDNFNQPNGWAISFYKDVSDCDKKDFSNYKNLNISLLSST